MKEKKNEQRAGDPKKPLDDADDDAPKDPAYSVVSARDGSAGAIGFDDLGQPRWTWITELGASTALTPDDTFDYLKALDNETLELADDSGVQPAPGDDAPPKSGYDPYDTARINLKGRFGRR